MKAIVKDTFRFGIVSVGVKVYSCVDAEAAVKFTTVHSTCGSKLKQETSCTKCGPISKEAAARAYEYARGRYVTVSDEDLEACAEAEKRGIDLVSFVAPSLILPLTMGKAYYLGPDKGDERAYAVLRTALSDTGRYALCWWTTKGKRVLVAVYPLRDVMVMQQLHFSEDVRTPDEIGVKPVELTQKERKLAASLIVELSNDRVVIADMKDETRGRVVSMLTAKQPTRDLTEQLEVCEAQARRAS